MGLGRPQPPDGRPRAFQVRLPAAIVLELRGAGHVAVRHARQRKPRQRRTRERLARVGRLLSRRRIGPVARPLLHYRGAHLQRRRDMRADSPGLAHPVRRRSSDPEPFGHRRRSAVDDRRRDARHVRVS